jgi:hypothetical protein
MRKIKIILIFIIFLGLFYSKAKLSASNKQVFRYTFSPFTPAYYKIFFNGYISYSPENAKPHKYIINGMYILKITNIYTSDKAYNLKISPVKGRFMLDGHTLEDITVSETEVSQIVPEMYIEMNKRGKIIKSRQGTGLFDFMSFLEILPCFPQNVVVGQRWYQTIPYFNLHFAKMPKLKFTYVYMGKQNGLDKFHILSNQFFHQQEKENNIKTKIKGINFSNGRILFDSQTDLIKQAKVHFKFSVYFIANISPIKTKEENNPIPYHIMVDISFLLSPVQIP